MRSRSASDGRVGLGVAVLAAACVGAVAVCRSARRKKSSTCCRSGSAGAALFSPAPAAPTTGVAAGVAPGNWPVFAIRAFFFASAICPITQKIRNKKIGRILIKIVEPGGQDCCVENLHSAMPHAARSSGLSSHSTLASAQGNAHGRDCATHIRIGLHVLQLVVIENAELAAAERLGHRLAAPRPRPRRASPGSLRSWRSFPAPATRPSPVWPRPWRGRHANRPRPDRPAAGRRCCRRRRYRRCRSTRFRTPSANRACGPAPPSKCGPDFRARSVCVSAEPMALTMPSPTRATIVSSVAPPMS